jgi:predicted ArsR family transcriptional regulator
MTIAEGRKRPTTLDLTKVRKWVESVDGDVTTGDVMTEFRVSRATARDKLKTLAEEGLLTRTGNGRGAKYSKAGPGPTRQAFDRAVQQHVAKRNGSKPVVPADLPGLLVKLASDCDRELERLDNELEAAEEALRAAEKLYGELTGERAKVLKAKSALTLTV